MIKWLTSPSPQPDICRQLQARAKHLFLRLEAGGTRAGSNFIKKINTPGNLWEARISHPSGAYRLFGMPTSGNRLVFVTVVMKKRDSLPSPEYKQLEARVREYVEAMGDDGC